MSSSAPGLSLSTRPKIATGSPSSVTAKIVLDFPRSSCTVGCSPRSNHRQFPPRNVLRSSVVSRPWPATEVMVPNDFGIVVAEAREWTCSVTALATGWVLVFVRWYTNEAASSVKGWNSTTERFPSVSVPVLSKRTAVVSLAYWTDSMD